MELRHHAVGNGYFLVSPGNTKSPRYAQEDSMTRVVVVGGGLAGVSAVRTLTRSETAVAVTLISDRPDMHFRPNIPDVISTTIPSRYLLTGLDTLAHRSGVRFLQDEAVGVDFDNCVVHPAGGSEIEFDYLIIAVGSRTNFHGNSSFEASALTVDSVDAGVSIAEAIRTGTPRRYVISGGGYTGMEAAAHIRAALRRRREQRDILVVELSNTILPGLPDWMKHYTRKNLRAMNIDVVTGTSVKEIDEGRVVLSDGSRLDDALVVWSAGMKAAPLAARLGLPTGAQGRITTGPDLRVRENCFAAGDVACTGTGTACPRMSVQASIGGGATAARNVLRLIDGRPTRKFKLIDPGLIIPMANGRSCGTALGHPVKGMTATFLHYFMSAYRSIGIRNTLGVASSAARAVPRMLLSSRR